MLKKLFLILRNIFIRSKLKEIKIGTTQVWYGRVNNWDKDMSLLSKELSAIESAGVSGYLIEMTGYRNDKWTEAWAKHIEKCYKSLVEECRLRKLWLHVSISNDNLGKGKYGDDGKHTIAAEMAWFKRLCKIVKDNGSKNVIVQPVAETQTSGGKQFEAYCKNELAGFLTCYNGNGGRPSSSNGFTYYAVHPSKISAKNPQNSFVISDHGQLIRELNIGGQLNAHGNPSNIAVWVKNNKAVGVPVIGYYAFIVEDLDKDAIKALGKACK